MAESEKNYKETLNLPKTDFPMRANLPQNEPKIVDSWAKNKVYSKMLKPGKKSKRFVMPDGPPYANGDIHVGHVLNKVLKDIVIKYKNLQGFETPFIPGWDCHGLPIELKVTKTLGKKRAELTEKDIRELCRKEANTWVNTQREQFKRLGILADWENPYLTLQPDYEAEEVRVLAKIHDNGLLYRGEKPVYWCPALQTALAAAEVEYRDHTSPSIYLKFEVEDKKELLSPNNKKTSFVIWTTTPWTIPANYGICLNANFEYGVYDIGAENIIVAKELSESVAKACDIEMNLVGSFKGADVERVEANHPFLNRKSLLMVGDHVTLEAGTGCVHTAPGHGMDDYHVGLKYDLPVSSPVDKAGRYTSEFKEMEGVKIWEANKLLVEKFKESGHLLAFTQLTHSYPHNPRSKTPLIFRATPQWFINLDEEKFGLRKKALEAAEKDIEFVPAWGSKRLNGMLTSSPDWCLSRQRIWGVPIPVFYCNKCEEALVDSEVMNRVADKMEESGQGIEAYFSEDISTFTQGKKCSCGNDTFERSKDILDVWFDSGICHAAVQSKREGLSVPADLYLEGSDQHRGWFQTSLLSSLAANDQVPFKTLVTHGFVNDTQGNKMSKSQGNTLDPATVISKYGAEILRLWVSYEDYGQDVNVSNEIYQRVSETYRRIRNTMRFLLGNISDFNIDKDAIYFEKMPYLDKWALMRLNALTEKVTAAYDNYDFYKVYHALNNFFTVDLSAVYLDILKDRLYTWKANGVERRSSQTVLYILIDQLSTMMAPVLSFLAEEVHGYLPGNKKASTVFEKEFPVVNPQWSQEGLLEEMETLVEVRSEVSKLLEDLRREKTIGSSLDAKVAITTKGNKLVALKKYKEHLKEFFIVSGISLSEGDDKIDVAKADGEKCVRCWHYSTELGLNSDHKEICPKCTEALI